MRNMCLFLRTKFLNPGLDIRQTYSQLLFNRLQIGSLLVFYQRQCRKPSTVLKSLLFQFCSSTGRKKMYGTGIPGGVYCDAVIDYKKLIRCATYIFMK